MNILDKIKTIKTNINSKKHRSRYVMMFSVLFAFLYHFSFLFIFLALKIYPMFLFNIASSTIFVAVGIYLYKPRNPFFPFLISTLEVFTHQFLATYYLGGNAEFFFLVLIMAVIPYVIFEDTFKYAVGFSVLPVFLFCGAVIFSDNFIPHAEVSANVIFVIRIINITVSIFAVMTIILLFVFAVRAIENNLEDAIAFQSEKLLKQNERIIEIQKNTIISLSNLVENRDSDTGEHVRRTSEYVNLLARNARKAGYKKEIITPDFIELCTRAAPMHDIGKIVVSDVILKKNGKLTDEEFEQMKLHAKEGGRIIEEIFGDSEDKEYVRIAKEIATGHHEKWNGCGYPNQLKGEEIPLSARIMALADVFDALVSPRCYKEPFSVEQSFQIIKESSGSHFDPILAEIFLKSRKEIEEILQKYQDVKN